WDWARSCGACASSPPTITPIPQRGSRRSCWRDWRRRAVLSQTRRRRKRGSPVVEAVIVSTARPALTKSWRGPFNLTHGATLGGHVVRAALERVKIDPASVEDVIMG